MPLVELYKYHQDRNTSPSLAEIKQTLNLLLEPYTVVYCIVDALDECSEEIRWELLESLDSLQPKLRILVTSRYLDSIAEELEKYARFEIKANKDDIELFIDRHIKKNRNLRKLVDKSCSLRDDIKSSVVRTAENM